MPEFEAAYHHPEDLRTPWVAWAAATAVSEPNLPGDEYGDEPGLPSEPMPRPSAPPSPEKPMRAASR